MIVGRKLLKSSLIKRKDALGICKPSFNRVHLKPAILPSASRLSLKYSKETDPTDEFEDDPYKHVLNPDEEVDRGVNIMDNFSDFDPEGENPFKDQPELFKRYRDYTESEEEYYRRKLLEDDERLSKLHKNLGGHMASKIRPVHKDDVYKWTDLRRRVLRNAPKPGNLPRIKHVTFVPERQSDEIVIQKPVEIEHDLDLLQYDEEDEDIWVMPDTPNRYLPKETPYGYSFGYGRRKSAVANVTLRKGTGNITINGKHWIYYFKDYPVRNKVIEPLTVTETLNKWDIDVRVKGGGFTGQSGAISLAIAKAIMRFDEAYIAPLRLAGLLANDPRRVERKKTGRHKARRSFQWVKR